MAISDEYPLLLTNAKEEAYMLSGFKGVASVRIIRPDPVVELHPHTAKKYGLEKGGWAYIVTKEGKTSERPNQSGPPGRLFILIHCSSPSRGANPAKICERVPP